MLLVLFNQISLINLRWLPNGYATIFAVNAKSQRLLRINKKNGSNEIVKNQSLTQAGSLRDTGFPINMVKNNTFLF